MASNLDLIKEYLIGIGFQIDKESFQTANNSMDDAKEKVEEFNKKSSQGFSDTSTSLKNLFSILNSSGTIKRLFPNLAKPLQDLITDIKTVKKLYDELDKTKNNEKEVVKETKSKKTVEEKINKENIKNKVNEDIKTKTTENIQNIKNKVNEVTKTKEKTREIETVKKKEDTKPKTNELTDSLNKTSIEDVGIAANETGQKVNGLKEGFKNLLTKGGSSLKTFATSSVVQFALVAGSIMALIVAIKKLISYLKDLGDRDIEYEKLSRMLFTTKENAKEVAQALDILDASFQDLWLSPTLLKQFKELKRDAEELRLPPEFQDNLRLVQDIGFEFKRLKQLMSMLFQWIGHYIMEYLKGPMVEAKQGMQDFNSWLIQHMPEIAKVIGSLIGGFLRLLLVVGKVLSILWKLTSPIRAIFKQIGEVKKSIDGIPEEVKKGARIIFAAIIFAFSPILLVIALIDDLLTYFRGGQSVIGDVLDWIKDKWKEFIDDLVDRFWILRKLLDIRDAAKDWWSTYYEAASEYLEKLWGKAKKILSDIKEWTSDAFDKGKNWVKDKWNKGKEWIFGSDDNNDENLYDLGDKVIKFERDYGNPSSTVTQSYMTNNSNSKSHTETHTSNEVNNENNINVYSTDANQTANVIDRRLQGITARNLQGGVS